MTAQISDTFLFRGDDYSLIGMSEGDLATPEQFGMVAEMIHTACYRGFVATYELTDKALYLREFTLREKDGNYVPIQGVKPVNLGHQATYHDLSVLVPFTGSLRIAKDFIQDLYVHMGYQKPSAFETVLDITLRNGRVVDIQSRSKEMGEKRGSFKKRYGSGDLMKWIKRAFSLDMDQE